MSPYPVTVNMQRNKLEKHFSIKQRNPLFPVTFWADGAPLKSLDIRLGYNR